MTSIQRTYPPPAHTPAQWHDAGCQRCEQLEGRLRHLREERNELLLRVHELESAERQELPRKSARVRRHTPIGMPSARAPMPVPEGSGVRLVSPAPPEMPLGGVMPREQGIDFGAVSRLTPEQLDRLPYGLITLDREGRVVHYNDTEARMVGLPKERVLGRNFFAEVAPCTRVREFEGRFRELARNPTGVRVQSFDFSFVFARSEQQVSIVMTPARRRGHFHVALIRRAIRAR